MIIEGSLTCVEKKMLVTYNYDDKDIITYEKLLNKFGPSNQYDKHTMKIHLRAADVTPMEYVGKNVRVKFEAKKYSFYSSKSASHVTGYKFYLIDIEVI